MLIYIYIDAYMFFKHIVFFQRRADPGLQQRAAALGTFRTGGLCQRPTLPGGALPTKKTHRWRLFSFFSFFLFFLCFFSRCFRPGFRIQGRNGIVGLMGSHDQVLPVIVPAGGEDLAPSKDLSSSNAFNGCFMI